MSLNIHHAPGTKLKINIIFHSQTDKQLKVTIHILKDLCKPCTLSYRGSWKKHLLSVEFANNNSF
jgi:hypothetical protein